MTSPTVTTSTPDPQESWYQPGTTRDSAFIDVRYEYLPDDPGGTVVSVMFRAQVKDIPWATAEPKYWTGDGSWPPAARTGEPFNAGGVLLTPEQFVTLAKNSAVTQTISTVNDFLHQHFP